MTKLICKLIKPQQRWWKENSMARLDVRDLSAFFKCVCWSTYLSRSLSSPWRKGFCLSAHKLRPASCSHLSASEGLTKRLKDLLCLLKLNPSGTRDWGIFGTKKTCIRVTHTSESSSVWRDWNQLWSLILQCSYAIYHCINTEVVQELVLMRVKIIGYIYVGKCNTYSVCINVYFPID